MSRFRSSGAGGREQKGNQETFFYISGDAGNMVYSVQFPPYFSFTVYAGNEEIRSGAVHVQGRLLPRSVLRRVYSVLYYAGKNHKEPEGE